MSRIGKMLITMPDGVTLTQEASTVTVVGPKGTLHQHIEPEIGIQVQDATITVSVAQASKRSAALWGLYRSLIANMVIGVSEGFSKRLEMSGVGHRAVMQGSSLQLSVGFSHPVIMPAPEGIAFTVSENTKISVSGISKEHVGQVAATIRAVKPPEPYKGKGIKYAGEKIRRKAGKAAKAVGGK